MNVFAAADPVFVAAAMCKTLIEHPDTPPHREVWLLLRCGYPAREIDRHLPVARRARDELTKGNTR
jgi:hypothetical protein